MRASVDSARHRQAAQSRQGTGGPQPARTPAEGRPRAPDTGTATTAMCRAMRRPAYSGAGISSLTPTRNGADGSMSFASAIRFQPSFVP